MKKVINMLLKRKAAANLTAYSLSIDTYVTITEKESLLRKIGIFLERVRQLLFQQLETFLSSCLCGLLFLIFAFLDKILC